MSTKSFVIGSLLGIFAGIAVIVGIHYYSTWYDALVLRLKVGDTIDISDTLSFKVQNTAGIGKHAQGEKCWIFKGMKADLVGVYDSQLLASVSALKNPDASDSTCPLGTLFFINTWTLRDMENKTRKIEEEKARKKYIAEFEQTK